LDEIGLLIKACCHRTALPYANLIVVLRASRPTDLREITMSDFVRICAQSELPASGQVREFVSTGRALCVANVFGSICVLDGTCPHEGGPLGEGIIEHGRVVCPWHGFAFDARTGVTQDDPGVKAEVFEAKVENGELLVKL
jgi:nitrite reductase (NADH) small subunit